VLLGRSYETEQIRPFGPWIDAFRAGQVGRELGIAGPADSTWRGELAQLLPELGKPAAGGMTTRQLFEAVAHLVGWLAARHPLVVILEDLHWADEMSVRLLAFLGRRVEGSPVLLVATVREEELVDAPLLRRMLEDLRRDDSLVTLRLASLSRAETSCPASPRWRGGSSRSRARGSCCATDSPAGNRPGPTGSGRP
jgi:AAA ATPase domain